MEARGEGDFRFEGLEVNPKEWGGAAEPLWRVAEA